MPRQTTYSDELDDIMGRIPGWVLRWGILTIMIILAVILLLSYLVKYPEMIEVPVRITTTNPPADLIAKSSGKIEELKVSDNSYLHSGEVVAILFNTANYSDVFQVEQTLTGYGEDWGKYINTEFSKKSYNVGELQSILSQFNTAIENYNKFLAIDYIGKRILNLKNQIKRQKYQLEYTESSVKLVENDYELQLKNYQRDISLHEAKVVSDYDLEKSAQILLQKQMSLVGQKNSLSQIESNIENLEGQTTELQSQQETELNDLRQQLRNNRLQLATQIYQWRDRYVITSPIDGYITFTRYWNENQNITAGERLATVVPQESNAVIGKMFIPSASLGKIKIGQTVHVKLNGYPYMEFGILKGKLKSISDVPDQEGYFAEVNFDNGLISTYKIPFDLIQQMDGTAGIVTRDLRLIERFFMPIKNLLNNN